MKKGKQDKFIRMYHQVRDLMESNLEKWKNIPEMRKTYDGFVRHLKKLTDLQPDLEMDLEPLREEWKQKRKRLVSKSFPVANVLWVYEKDQAKEANTDFGISLDKMNGLKNKKLLKTASLVFNKAEEYRASGLEAYGLDDSMIMELEDALRQYESAMKMRTDMLLNRKKSLREFRLHFKAIQDLLAARLDKLMTVFSGTHPSFYKAYFKARKGKA
jgi:hypothetical protein